MWYMCGLCVPVMVISGCPFTSGHCIDHVNSDSHKKTFTRHEHPENKKQQNQLRMDKVLAVAI